MIDGALREGRGRILNRAIRGHLRRPDGTERDFVQFLFPVRSTHGFFLGSISPRHHRHPPHGGGASTQPGAAPSGAEAGGDRGRLPAESPTTSTTSSPASWARPPSSSTSFLRTAPSSMTCARWRAPPCGQPSSPRRSSRSPGRSPVWIWRPLDPASVIGEVTRLLERTIDKSITIRVDLPRSLPHIRGNAGQIHKAILNLCLNARDAMPHGGALTIAAAPVEKEIWRRAGGWPSR